MGFERELRQHVCPLPFRRENLLPGTTWRCDGCGQLYELRKVGFLSAAVAGQLGWRKVKEAR
jgi:hypothetical protein